MDERVKTGIDGLDAALNGGIPKGNLVLISGGAGTGKSTLCMQYLLAGAKAGENCLYVSTEQSDKEFLRQAEKYGWPLKELIDAGKIRVLYVDILSEDNAFSKIIDTISSFSPSRVAVDSLTTFSEYTGMNEYSKEVLLKRGGVALRSVDQIMPLRVSERTVIKRMLASLLARLRSTNATILLTSELPEKGNKLSSDGISEFLADGVLMLNHLGVGLSQFRSLQVRKMRYTGHSNDTFGYDFKQNGIEFVENAV